MAFVMKEQIGRHGLSRIKVDNHGSCVTQIEPCEYRRLQYSSHSAQNVYGVFTLTSHYYR